MYLKEIGKKKMLTKAEEVELGRKIQEGKPYDAEHWYLQSARQGNVKAMYNIAVLYESRFFYAWDKAGYWYAEAASRGESRAEAILQNNYFYDRRQQRWMKRM